MLLPESRDNYAATLIALAHAARCVQERGPFRCVFFHVNEHSVAQGAASMQDWRESGVYLTKAGKSLPKKDEWRALVEATEGLDFHILYAAKGFNAARGRMAEIKDALSLLTPAQGETGEGSEAA